MKLTKEMQRAIKEIYQDDDGWWVVLQSKYEAQYDEGSVVNGETFKDLYNELKMIKKRN